MTQNNRSKFYLVARQDGSYEGTIQLENGKRYSGRIYANKPQTPRQGTPRAKARSGRRAPDRRGRRTVRPPEAELDTAAAAAATYGPDGTTAFTTACSGRCLVGGWALIYYYIPMYFCL